MSKNRLVQFLIYSLITFCICFVWLLFPSPVSATTCTVSVRPGEITTRPVGGNDVTILEMNASVVFDPPPPANTYPQYMLYLSSIDSTDFQEDQYNADTAIATHVFTADCTPGVTNCQNLSLNIPMIAWGDMGGFQAVIDNGDQPFYAYVVEMPATGKVNLCRYTVNLSSYIPEMESVLELNEEEPPTENPLVVGNPMDGVTAETFDALNPLNQFSEGVEEDLTTPGGILTRVLRFAFPIAGFILFIMLIWAGFEIVSGATAGQKSLDAGKQRATAAIIGFILLFISYFIAQLLQVVFGIKIL